MKYLAQRGKGPSVHVKAYANYARRRYNPYPKRVNLEAEIVKSLLERAECGEVSESTPSDPW